MFRKGLAPKSHPPNLFSACPKFRNSGERGGFEESTAGVGLHQNAKISFNKGKVWKRGEGGSKGFEAKTVSRPFHPLVCFRRRCILGIWLLSSFRTIAQGLRFPPPYNCIIRIFSPPSSSICIFKDIEWLHWLHPVSFQVSTNVLFFCGLLGLCLYTSFTILSYKF